VTREPFVIVTSAENPCSARSTSPFVTSANGARFAGPSSASSASVTLSTSVVIVTPSTGARAIGSMRIVGSPDETLLRRRPQGRTTRRESVLAAERLPPASVARSVAR
jgi:hypothetical protein